MYVLITSIITLLIVLQGVDNQLQNSTMRDLVVTGHATISVIINALISKYDLRCNYAFF